MSGYRVACDARGRYVVRYAADPDFNRKHPRGQPKNAGQFAPKGRGSRVGRPQVPGPVAGKKSWAELSEERYGSSEHRDLGDEQIAFGLLPLDAKAMSSGKFALGIKRDNPGYQVYASLAKSIPKGVRDYVVAFGPLARQLGVSFGVNLDAIDEDTSSERDIHSGWIMSYQRGLHTITINPGSQWFHDPSGKSQTLRKVGWLSTPEAWHPVAHEMAHAMHALVLEGKKWPLRWSATDDKIAVRKVSRYALTSPAEFVAETFCGLCSGKKYPASVLAMYRKYRGPEIDFAAMRAILDHAASGLKAR